MDRKKYNKKRYESMKYHEYEKGAKRRNMLFELSKEEFDSITNQPCFYCGEKNDSSNGIDRIDNKIGYILNNCLPCCSMCNWMKQNLSQDVFLKHIEKIYNHATKNSLMV